ncbi:MAG: PQQ-binding-like beta-propeller repeat protein, partial [Chlamydiota bacterium]
MKRRLYLGMAMSCFMAVLFVLPLLAQLDPNSPWPMFHGNAQHTGQSAYTGSQTGTLLWSYQTGSYVFSPPAIGFDGRVYVGSLDSSIYGLNS